MLNEGEDRRVQGRRIEARRLRLGIRNYSEFSRASGIARATLKAAEEGTASHQTYVRLERWLEDQGAQEVADPLGSGDTVTFEVSGPGTEWQVRVSGPAGDADKLRQHVVELLREWRTP